MIGWVLRLRRWGPTLDWLSWWCLKTDPVIRVLGWELSRRFDLLHASVLTSSYWTRCSTRTRIILSGISMWTRLYRSWCEWPCRLNPTWSRRSPYENIRLSYGLCPPSKLACRFRGGSSRGARSWSASTGGNPSRRLIRSLVGALKIICNGDWGLGGGGWGEWNKTQKKGEGRNKITFV